MNQITAMAIYLALGAAGGLLGSRLKITGGAMIGAMLAVMTFKLMAARPCPIPQSFSVVVQILIGIVVGAGCSPQLGRTLSEVIYPVLASTLFLVGAGFIMSLVLVKLRILDAPTAYLGTSPGAMSAMLTLAQESDANPPVVLAFHFFRIVFVIVTAPLAFNLIRTWFPSLMAK